jgi:hypothetical protein
MNCGTCGKELNVTLKPETLDCGGDCLQCMADAGDPECAELLRSFSAPDGDSKQINAYEAHRIQRIRDNSVPALRWTFIGLSILTFLLSSLTSFVGLMSPFTGFGEGLASIGMHTIFYSMMAALPAYLFVGAFSRRMLAWVYCVLYAIASVGVYLLETANSVARSVPLRLATSSPLWSAARAFAALSSITVLCLALAVLAEFMFRVERRRKRTLAEIS